MVLCHYRLCYYRLCHYRLCHYRMCTHVCHHRLCTISPLPHQDIVSTKRDSERTYEAMVLIDLVSPQLWVSTLNLHNWIVSGSSLLVDRRHRCYQLSTLRTIWTTRTRITILISDWLTTNPFTRQHSPARVTFLSLTAVATLTPSRSMLHRLCMWCRCLMEIIVERDKG